MDWGNLISVLIGGVTVGTPLTYYLGIRKDRRETGAETRANTAQQVDIVTKLMHDNLELHGKMDALYGQVDAARSDASEARRLVDAVRARLARIVTEFKLVLAWIDAGANPPAPAVSAEIRRLLDEPDEDLPT